MIKIDLQLTLVQYNIIWESASANFKKIETLLNHSTAYPDLILLPEMFNSGFTLKPQNVATIMNGEVVQWMQMLSLNKNAVVAGSVVIVENNSFYNRLIVAHPTGKIDWYDKRHLFRMGGENDSYKSGNKRVIIDVNGWRLALFVCYDLRFPVWSRSVNDYDLALYIANWPAARNNVWETLLKARAIENQCYVAGVNRVGIDGLGAYIGNSMIVDFNGGVLNQIGNGNEGIIETSISLKALNDFKTAFPAWMDADQFTICED